MTATSPEPTTTQEQTLTAAPEKEPPRFVSEYQRRHAEQIADLKEAALELVRIAETVKGISERGSSALDRLTASAALTPSTAAFTGSRHLIKALTRQSALGVAYGSGSWGTVVQGAASVVGRGNLFTDIMATSLKARLDALRLAHPELEGDVKLTRFIDAVYADRDTEAMRALQALFKDRGFIGALSRLAPISNELLSLKALQDENPFNDKDAWNVAAGRCAPAADLLFGIPYRLTLTRMDHGYGTSRPLDATPYEREAVESRGSFLGFLRNIDLLGNDGRILIQSIEGPDGEVRHVIQVPGTRPGAAWNDSPQDLSAAFRVLIEDKCSYLGAIKNAVERYGIPDGAEIALVGHSLGGIVSMVLSQDAAFCRRYTLTHVASIGSPISHKRPADPATKVISVINQHDAFIGLDGIGPGSCFPVPPGWYVVDYTEPTHQFPECHSPSHYRHDLEHLLAEPLAYIDELLTPYRGQVVRSQLYMTSDEESAERSPFLSVATRAQETSTGVVELPVTCTETDTLVALFGADAGAVAELVPDPPGGPAVPCGPGKVLVALTAVDTRASSLGAHRQIALGVVVRGPWAGQIPPLTDLFRSGDHRGFGLAPFHVLADTDRIAAVCRDVWGYPAEESVLRVRIDRTRALVHARGEQGRTLLLDGGLGWGLPGGHGDLVSYARRSGSLLRSLIETDARPAVHLVPTARLRLGGRRNPLGDQLRGLGLDGQRPLLCLTTRGVRARFGAGAPV